MGYADKGITSFESRERCAKMCIVGPWQLCQSKRTAKLYESFLNESISLTQFIMPASVYIESSIISYLTSRPSRDVIKAARHVITSDWWLNSKSQFEVYISALVEDEISGGDPMAAAKRLQGNRLDPPY